MEILEIDGKRSLNLNMQLRMEVLKASLQVEYLINEALRIFWNLPKEQPTRTLSNKATAISFQTKIDILFDLGCLDKFQHECFGKFMNVRNQLMHNAKINSCVAVAEHIDGLENWLTRHFSKPLENLFKAKDPAGDVSTIDKKEDQLWIMIFRLNLKLSDILMVIADKMIVVS